MAMIESTLFTLVHVSFRCKGGYTVGRYLRFCLPAIYAGYLTDKIHQAVMGQNLNYVAFLEFFAFFAY